MDCPKCGTENSPQSRFCRNCGFDIKGITAETPGQPRIPPVPSSMSPAVPATASTNPLETTQNPVQPETIVIENPPPTPLSNFQPPTAGAQVTPGFSSMPTIPPYAGFWLRFVANLLDGLIIGVAISPVTIIYFIYSFMSRNSTDFWPNFFFSALINIFTAIVSWLYYAFMESSSKQGTLGKMALGLKVTDLTGNRISFGRATGRYFGKILSQIILDIGFLMIAFTEKKQGLHDIIAGTLVVKK
jgi:uncharacterized RDD family membrane protein YckC